MWALQPHSDIHCHLFKHCLASEVASLTVKSLHISADIISFVSEGFHLKGHANLTEWAWPPMATKLPSSLSSLLLSYPLYPHFMTELLLYCIIKAYAVIG